MSEIATFGAGCFWGVEAAFQQVPGVIDTAVGYSGGETPNPTYKDVCTDETGHAEVVQVTFDPAKVSYEQLLDVFWKAHDPTQVNRQGPDFGTQYRTAIFTHSPEQEAMAKKSRAALEAMPEWTEIGDEDRRELAGRLVDELAEAPGEGQEIAQLQYVLVRQAGIQFRKCEKPSEAARFFSLR